MKPTGDKKMELPNIKDVKLELARRNYYEYIKYVHEGEYEDIKHGRYIAQVLDNAIKKKQRMERKEIPKEKQFLIINLPPRHSKSMTITETFPSYFFGKFPKQRSILISYGDELSKRFSRKNMQKVAKFGWELFGIGLDPSTRSVTDWDINNTSGGCNARGMLAGITGFGGDLLIIDDPIKTKEEANSEIYRNKIWEEWKSSISPRLHPTAIVIVIMTRWHEDDLVGRLLNEEYGKLFNWNVMNLPLEAEENDLLGREIGEPLWEEKYGYDFIEERKSYPQEFNSLYQGRPTSQEGNILKKEWWKFYDTLPNMHKLILSVDASFKGDKNNDKVSIQVWGKTGADIYLVDNDTRRLDFVSTIQAIKNMLKKHPSISGKYVEDKANGSAIINVLNKKIGGFIPVKVDAGSGGKVARVEAVSAWIESGNIYLPRNKHFTKEFIEECSSFPKGKNDDQVDCMSQALSKLVKFSAIKPKVIEIDAFRTNENRYNELQPVITKEFINFS